MVRWHRHSVANQAVVNHGIAIVIQSIVTDLDRNLAVASADRNVHFQRRITPPVGCLRAIVIAIAGSATNQIAGNGFDADAGRAIFTALAC
jgi:hypothetical protein